jgi:hypothetical protein
MEGILKIPNFQIPNINMGCIKTARNNQGATFQSLKVLKGKSNPVKPALFPYDLPNMAVHTVCAPYCQIQI